MPINPNGTDEDFKKTLKLLMISNQFFFVILYLNIEFHEIAPGMKELLTQAANSEILVIA